MTSNIPFGPSFTPRLIRQIIICSLLCSVFAAFTNPLFLFLFDYGPIQLLSLSQWGLNHYLWWQPLTYLFIHPSDGTIDISFLLSLGLNMYVVWAFGSQIYAYAGHFSFLGFYLCCGLIPGLLAAWAMPLLGYYGYLAGAGPAVLGILTAWALRNPDAEVLLFFLIPLKAIWLIWALIAAIFLITLSNFDLIHLLLFSSALVTAYIYGLIAWGVHSPFPLWHTYELAFLRAISKISGKRLFGRSHPKKKKKSESKVVEIRPSHSIEGDDERFVDAMLEKISKNGPHALSPKEKERMHAISEKKRKDRLRNE